MNLKIDSRMKSVYRILYALIVILILTNIYLLNEVNDGVADKKQILEAYKQDLINERTRGLKLITEIVNANQNFNKSILKDQDVIFPILIYRYPEAFCESCINEDLNELYEFQEKIGYKRILILPSYQNTRENKILMQRYLSKFCYINIPLESMYIPIDYDENKQIRYMAVLDSSDNIRNIFFPERGNIKMTRSYFVNIENLFLKNE